MHSPSWQASSENPLLTTTRPELSIATHSGSPGTSEGAHRAVVLSRERWITLWGMDPSGSRKRRSMEALQPALSTSSQSLHVRIPSRSWRVHSADDAFGRRRRCSTGTWGNALSSTGGRYEPDPASTSNTRETNGCSERDCRNQLRRFARLRYQESKVAPGLGCTSGVTSVSGEPLTVHPGHRSDRQEISTMYRALLTIVNR